LLRDGFSFLLDLPLWFPDLQPMHGGKPLGVYLQRNPLAMSRLWGHEALLIRSNPMKPISPGISGGPSKRNVHKVIKDPALHVILYQPEIPANTGNIARLCAAAEVRLHLVFPLGFKVDDRHLKRAGLDYWSEVDIRYHDSFKSFLGEWERNEGRSLFAFSRHASVPYTEAQVGHGDGLLFGKETRGLPPEILENYPAYRIPIWGRVRSLNLSTSVGIVVYHCLHRMGRF